MLTQSPLGAEELKQLSHRELKAVLSYYGITITEWAKSVGSRHSEVSAIVSTHDGGRLDLLYPELASMIASKTETA